jgi:hypothetical protein
VYFFRFERAALPPETADEDVEFKLAAGRTKITQKFRFAGMEYQGRLAL